MDSEVLVQFITQPAVNYVLNNLLASMGLLFNLVIRKTDHVPEGL
jgi:hypothetical protein